MSGSSTLPTPTVSPAEMQVLLSRAGLTLNPGQMADLVLAWRQVVGLLTLIPRDRPLLDDQAFVFRLPPPVPAAKPAAAPASAPDSSGSAKSAAKQPAAKQPASKQPAKKPTPKKPTGKRQATAHKTARSLSSGGPSARPGGRR